MTQKMTKKMNNAIKKMRPRTYMNRGSKGVKFSEAIKNANTLF